MEFIDFYHQLKSIKKSDKTFLSVNFGCRVNAAESTQLSQILVREGYSPINTNTVSPDVIIINTCSITKKGDIESISKARALHQQHPNALIFLTGCANIQKLKDTPNIFVFDNQFKEKLLEPLDCKYDSSVADKFSNSQKYLLKIQSGCTAMCSYCTVPYKRQYLWSLSIDKAITAVNNAIHNGYQHIIITGVNLNQYSFGFSNLLEELLLKTNGCTFSFGSLPIKCIDERLISLFKNPDYYSRLSHFLHIPLQSGSDTILKAMNRNYSVKDISQVFKKLSTIPGLTFGTDIIVGFPGETDKEFKATLDLCQQIGFKKIHTFKYSPRPQTYARYLFEKSPKISKLELKSRSQQIRSLVIA